MIIGIGTDIIEVERIKNSIEKYGERFLNRIYSKTEQDYSNGFNENKHQHFAARFAVKEAFSKAIGTGITQGFKFSEISLHNEPIGKPVIDLSGSLAEKWGAYIHHVTISHTAEYAVAFVVIEKPD